MKNKTLVPIIKFKLIGGKEGYGIVDTGSESTAFDLQFVKKNKALFTIETTDKTMNLVGVSHNNDTQVIYATAHITFKESPDADIKIKGLVLDLSHITSSIGHSPAALFGSDTLSKIRAKVNYDRKYLSLYYDLPR